MSNWSPKPLRPVDPNPMFSQGDDTYTVTKAQTPIQRQRAADGSPHTNTRNSALEAADTSLYLENALINKSAPKAEKASLDPAEVVKSFIAKDDDKEDAEKGTVGEVVGGAMKTGVQAATGAVTGAASMARPR